MDSKKELTAAGLVSGAFCGSGTHPLFVRFNTPRYPYRRAVVRTECRPGLICSAIDRPDASSLPSNFDVGPPSMRRLFGVDGNIDFNSSGALLRFPGTLNS